MRISDWSSDVCSSDLFSTRLGADAADVWALVSTMDGVNAELRPLLRMTHPPHLRSLTDATWEPGEVIHQSWLLAGGILPIDRHGLALERVLPGEGFDEESSSWLQRRWRHERRRSEEHTSELQSLMRISYAVFCLKKKKKK